MTPLGFQRISLERIRHRGSRKDNSAEKIAKVIPDFEPNVDNVPQIHHRHDEKTPFGFHFGFL